MNKNILIQTEYEIIKSLADFMVSYISEKLKVNEYFTLVLSGGNTPNILYKFLSSYDYKDKINWSKVIIFYGDERFVNFNDERNNASNSFKNLLNNINIPKENINIIKTEDILPEESAKDYENILKKYFKDKKETFDLVLLGMGDDGHTLSLFPNNKESIDENIKWCTSLWLESQKMYRVTLTKSVVNLSSVVIFLVMGDSKSKTLKNVIEGKFTPYIYPSQIINPLNGNLYWYVDEKAGKLLDLKNTI